MFTTTLKHIYVVYSAYAVRIGLFSLLWGLSSPGLAEVSMQNVSSTFLAALHVSHGTALNDRVMRSAKKALSRAYRMDHFDDHHMIIPREQFFQNMHTRLPVTANARVYEIHATYSRSIDDLTGQWTFRDDNAAIPYSTGERILEPILFRYSTVREYGRMYDLHAEGEKQGGASPDLYDFELCPDPSRFLHSPRDRFRIEAYYQQDVTQLSWIDPYETDHHSMINTVHFHRDYDTIIPSPEDVDKSLAAVYLPDGKMISLRYEDREGGSVFSELTLFFR